MNPRVFLITGVMAAGKSTVAQALAERLPQGVHLRGDTFRRMIVTGRAEPGPRLDPEAERQLRLRYAIAVQVARMYHAAGFSVVYQDIILGQSLAEVAGWFEGVPLTLVVLCPEARIVASREAARTKAGYRHPADLHFFDRVLRTETPRIGAWVDTSLLTVGETVERILALAEESP